MVIGGIHYSGGHLVVFRWAFEHIHNMWAFGGIQVGKTWCLLSEMGNTSGPPSKYQVGPSYSKTQHG